MSSDGLPVLVCEAAVTSTDAQGISLLAEQAAAQGITYMVAAGDTGAEGCDNLGETTALGPVSVSALASTPFTVAVGGTLFNENGQETTYWGPNNSALGSALSYIPEDVWNETCTTQCQVGQTPLAAGGGGASVFFPKPSWQSGSSGIQGDTARDVPDVSLTAAGHDPYLLCLEGSCAPDARGNIFFYGVEGTSASTPSFASVMALVDQSQGSRQGQADYVLYPLATAQEASGIACNASTTPLPASTCVFNDVTVGNNAVPGEPGYPNGQYSAAAGYDLASGLGSVNVSNLVNAWASASFRPTTTTLALNSGTTLVTITHGQSVDVAVTVTPNSGTGTPKGDVSLIAATINNGQSVPPTAGFQQQVFTLSGGSVASATTQLSGGNYTVTAHYAGDGTFAPSDSSPGISLAVSGENSTTTLSAVDQNLNPISGSTLPFGSLVYVRADVAGFSHQGVPTGMVTFTDTAPIFPGPVVYPVPNPAPLNSQGNTSIGDGVLNFDAGTHIISAIYAGDHSFNQSPVSNSVTFTIQPGFAGVTGPTDVTITSPGLASTSTMGILTSTGFSTPVTFTCAGLPAEATCSSTPLTGSGPNTIANASITVTTTAAHVTMLQGNQRPYYFAMFLAGGLPLAGIFLVGARSRRRSVLVGFMVVLAFVSFPGCGGGGGSSGSGNHAQDPGTPLGTYTVTVTATAGSLSARGAFTLTVK